ncbi:hypothetical protein Ahy_B10g106065 [Arachis hypogaea]|uniref:Aminotransferase-like plant mobile domain-containing protein n=1 Tax=Arachis hypogaea TaxID=3818 RepID=A0A444X9Q7_ARAHY|nr:hypothetical protein Ahy_B10g106065 [Arachis hypogaea]
MEDDLDRIYLLDRVAHIAGSINEEVILPPADCIDKFTVKCTWMQDTFSELPQDVDEDTVRRYARAYIMILLSTQVFGEGSGTCLHIWWLPYVARGYGQIQLKIRCSFVVISMHVPCGQQKPPSITDLQTVSRFQMPYSSPEVVQRVVTALIYVAVIEWHQVDRVLPQLGGVQHRPHAMLDINFLMSKDGRGRDRTLQSWHIHRINRAQHVLRFDVVPDSRPSQAYLEWWHEHNKRFLSPEIFLSDPKVVAILAETTQRGPGQVPDIDQVLDIPIRR